jgi:hypothetical protein
VPEYAVGKAKYSLPKESNLINQKCMRQETAAHNTKNQIKPSPENGKTEELKLKPIHGQSNWDLERPSVNKEKSMAWVCSSGLMGETEFKNSSPRSSTQHALSTEEHDKATN